MAMAPLEARVSMAEAEAELFCPPLDPADPALPPNGHLLSNGAGERKPLASLAHLPQRPPVDIAFSALSFEVPGGCGRRGKTLLQGVGGAFRSGELSAIMGPSGAGKSTLMNVLAGYKTRHVAGSVLVNGRERNLRRFRKLSCYIMQEECLLPHLTVREAMAVAARLKLGAGMGQAGRRRAAAAALEALGLNEARDTRTAALSGGQRKRLAIALELVNNPPVVFLDEPTSGLDSASCFACVALLKSLARGGRTVVATIHQPSARLFEMFDFLYTLSDGRCIYRDRVSRLVPFLSRLGLHCPGYHNPADYVLEVASGEHGDWLDRLVASADRCADLRDSPPEKPSCTVIELPASCTEALLEGGAGGGALVAAGQSERGGFPTSGLLQFWVLLLRTFRSIVRDPTLTHVRLASHAIVGVLIGGIYYDIGHDAFKVTSNAGCIFFTVMFTMFTAMMPTILTFPTEMNVFVREHMNYWYSLKAFYLAKTVADIPFQVVFSGVYVIIVYYMTGQPLQAERALKFAAINVLTALVAQSLGLLIGAGLDLQTGVYLGPVTTIPVVLFSGFFVNFNAVPAGLRWLTYASYVRYGFEGAMLAVYGAGREKLACSEAYCHFRSPHKFLQEMSMDTADYWLDVAALLAFFLLIRVASYLVLRVKLMSMQ